MRSFQISWALNPVIGALLGVLLRRRESTDRNEANHVMTGRDWSGIAASQALPRIPGNHEKLGKGKEGFFPEVFGESITQLTP